VSTALFTSGHFNHTQLESKQFVAFKFMCHNEYYQYLINALHSLLI